MLLQGKTALITGASKGIGRAIAVAFAQQGAALAVSGRAEDELQTLRTEVSALDGKCVVVPGDLSVNGAAEAIYHEAKESLGPIDILVNNAGMGSSANPKPVLEYDDDFWDLLIFVNLTVPYRLSKLVLPDMLERQRGRIINVASINGKIGSFHGAAYAASKHGLLGLTRTLAMEVVRDGVTVNAICPGPVHTLLNDIRIAYDAERMGITLDEIERRMTPMGRRLEPDEVAPLAVYLASDHSAAMTGQAINIDGGVLMAG